MANLVIGLYSPFKYGIKFYEGYDITKFKAHIIFMEVIEDRDYGANGQICPLLFDGAVSDFEELPRPDNVNAMAIAIRKAQSMTNTSVPTTVFSIFNIKSIKKLWKKIV